MAIVEQLISPEEYLKKEREGSREKYGKFEYFDGKLIEMGGASAIHNDICTNLMGLLWSILRGKGYKIAHGDLQVANLSKQSYCYPDIVVVKGEYEFIDNKFDTIRNPLLIIEVLSDSTQERDRGEKFQVYRELSSLREYVLVSQDTYLIERYFRQSNGEWTFSYQNNLEQSIRLVSIQQELLLKDVYEGVNL